MTKLYRTCKNCKHILDVHYEDGQCGKIVYTAPTEEEIRAAAEVGAKFGGTYGFCECPGYRE